ncbi:hypothetical protein AUK40_05260 [Candidatus Wirthbacteria bacterium CG2_30_54_11]|uniref:O-antigen ligase-related domain-containing protein n=1 Tax=Candidatus Wirthbacteria bacterium CG2_30_54_11 TaxID=1817892 RepID=A0A1J5IGF1_9BACT|nr:MAG: hypothetical protein AUK40_05260 [Candidatus Wirthbacteria bacterium CG2_30_54_11]
MWLFVIVVAPSWMITGTAQIFEIEKIALIRAGALLMTAAYVIAHLEEHRWPDLRRPLVRPALLWWGIFTLATFFSRTPSASFWGSYFRSQGWTTTTCYILIFLVISTEMKPGRQINRLLCTLTLGSLPVMLYALLQYLGLDPLIWQDMAYGSRVFSTLGQPNFLGVYLAMLIPLTCGLLLTARAVWQKTFCSLFAISQLTVLLWTGSRGAMIGLAAGLSCLLFLSIRTNKQRISAIIALSTLAAAVLLTAALPSPLQSQVQKSLRLSSPTADSRLFFLKGAILGIADRPLLGHGPESIYSTFPLYYDAHIALVDGVDSMPDRTHNEFADIAYTTGMIGLLAFFYLLFRTAEGAITALAERTKDRPLILGTLGSAGAFIVAVQFSFGTSISYLLFWTLLGVLSVMFGRTVPAEEELEAPAAPVKPARLLIYAAVMLISLTCLVRLALLPVMADREAKTAIEQGRQGDPLASAKTWYRAWSLMPEQTRYAYQTIMALVNAAAQPGETDGAALLGRAHEILDAIARKDFRDMQYYRTLGALLASEATLSKDQTEKLQEAVAAYQTALASAPNRSALHDELGLLYLQTNDLSKSESEFKKALELYPSPEHPAYRVYATHLAGVYLSQGKNREVIDLLAPLTEDAPAPDQMYLFLAYGYLAEHEPAAAIEQADRLPANSLPALSLRLKAYTQTGDTEQIRAAAQAILAIDPGNTEAQTALRSY